MYYSFPSRYSDAYRIELDSFVDVLSGHGKVPVSGKMTQAVSKIATACDQSARLVVLLDVGMARMRKVLHISEAGSQSIWNGRMRKFRLGML